MREQDEVRITLIIWLLVIVPYTTSLILWWDKLIQSTFLMMMWGIIVYGMHQNRPTETKTKAITKKPIEEDVGITGEDYIMLQALSR